ncbi:MAG: ACT domain-containing protein, partial [Trebonia sp.]
RAHDEPGLLWRIGRALGECGLNVRAARVETLGAEAVDVFYVTDSTSGLLSDPDARRRVVAAVLSALSSDLSIQNVRALLLRLRVRRPPNLLGPVAWERV